MTAALPAAEKIRTRYRAERQRFSEAQYVLRPPERLRVQAEALDRYLNRDDSVLDVGCGTGYLAYRSALAWPHDQTSCIARIPQEPEWFTVYPRVLFVCEL
jgi:methylase of polypeptide subunit release factors